MKNMLKRSLSLLLVCCMMLSFVAPVANAVGTDPDTGAIQYRLSGENINFGSSGYYRLWGQNIVNAGSNNTVNLPYTSGDFTILEYGSQTGNFRIYPASGTTPVRINTNSFQLADTATNKWMAIKFNVAKTGQYNLSLYTNSLFADVIVEAYDANKTYTDAYVAGLTAEGTHASTLKKTFVQGDYVLILRSNSTAKQNNAHFYGINLEPITSPDAPTLVEGVYNYTVSYDVADITVGNGYISYDDYQMGNFVYHAHSSYATQPMTDGSGISVNGTQFNNKWYALSFYVPVAGEYKVDVTATNASAKGMEFYFVPADNLVRGSGDATNNTYIDALDPNFELTMETSTTRKAYELGTVNFATAGYYAVVMKGTTTGLYRFFGMNLTKVTNDQTVADAVIDLIDAIGTVTLESEAAIIAAEEAFNGLTPAQQALVTNKAVLDQAKADLEALKNASGDEIAAQVVIDLIDAIGTVTLNSEADIIAALEAFEALTPAQQALVTNKAVLDEAKATYDELKAAADADAAAAQTVIDQIAAIGTVTLESEAAIIAAENAFNALTDAQKALVTNKAVLDAAKATLEALKDPSSPEISAEAQNVIDLIAAIGTVTVDSWTTITNVRTAYNALSTAQKNQVTNYQVLVAAEFAYFDLKNTTPDASTFDGIVYDFTTLATLLGTVNGGLNNLKNNKDEINSAYAAGGINFAYLESFTHVAGGDDEYDVAQLWTSYKNFTGNIHLHVSNAAGAWVAMKVKAPAAGTYRFQFYYPAEYNVNFSTKIDAFMIPMSAVEAAIAGGATAGEAVNSLLAGGNYAPVASKNIKAATNGDSADADDFWGDVTISATEQEYVVVFRATENKHGGTGVSTNSNAWLTLTGFSLTNPPSEQDIAAAEDVATQIGAIGVVTAGSKTEIENIRAAYEALTDKQKELVENLNILVAAETRLAEILDTSDGIEYIYKDPGNPKLSNGYPQGIGHTYGDFVDYARSNVTAFKPFDQNIQTQSGFSNGKWFGLKFTVAEAGDYDLTLNMYAYAAHAVTLDVYFVRADELVLANQNENNLAYVEALATDPDVVTYTVALQDSATWNLSGVQLDADDYVIIFKSTSAEGNFMFNYRGFKILRTGDYTGPEKVDPGVEDANAAQVVINQIAAIGTVTLESESAILAAREAFDALTPARQALVTNIDVLTAAEATLAQLKEAVAVDVVIDLIDAIGSEITLNSYTAIKAARDAYNALTDTQKAMVTNINVLTAAEAKIVELRNPNPDKDTFDGFVFDFIDAVDILGLADGKNTELTADKLQEYYTYGTLNFNMLGGNPAPWLWNNFKNYVNTTAITVQGYAGAWFGVQVKAPATGTFRFQFTYPSIYNVNLSTKVDAYMIPMSVITAALTGEATVQSVVEALIAGGTYAPVASKNVKKATNGDPADADDFWGNVELTKDVEYAVIFRATENKHSGTNPAATTSNVWLSISGFSLGNLPTEQDIEAAQKVTDKIGAIGIVTAGSKTEIEAVRAAYEALTEKQKGLVEGLNILEAAEARLAEILDTSDGIEYIYKDPGNPKLANGYVSGIGHVFGDFVDYARPAVTVFKPLAQSIQTQQAYGNGKWFALAFNVAQAGDYDLALDLVASSVHAVTLDVYFVRAENLNKANNDAENQAYIDALDENDAYKVVLADNSTYNLTGVQLDKDDYVIIFKNTAGQYSEEKGGNTNYMFNFRGFKINRTGDYTGPVKEDTSAQDNAAAKVVIDLIDAIGTVTLNSGDAIAAAREAYDALLGRQQALVTNYEILAAAEIAYNALLEANAAQITIDLIDAIGAEITLSSYTKIKAAREAYNALTDSQKAQVTNYDVLTAAEAKIVELRNPNPDKDTFDGFVFDFTDAVDVLGLADGKNSELKADKLQEYYATGTLNFNMLGGAPTPWLWNNFGNYTNTTSITVQGYAGAWFGVQVKAPATGTFRFQFTYPSIYNVNLSTKIDAYMIPMSAITGALTGEATVESVVEALIASGAYAPVASKNVKKATNGDPADADDFWGNVELTKDVEYAVIFRATENKHGGTNPATITSNVWLSVSGFSLGTPPTEQDKAEAQNVMDKIAAIGIVTAGSKTEIEAARAAYEALTDKQKELVENLKVLTDAEARLAEILDTSDGIEYIYKDPGNPKLANGYPQGIGYTYGDFVDYARSNVTAFKPMSQSIQTQAGYGNGKWFALAFNVAEAGNYDLALNLSAASGHATTLDVYFVRADSMIRANGNEENQAFVDALKASDAYKVDVNDKSTWNLSGVQLDKDAYVILFKNTAGQYSEEKESNINYMFNFRGFKITRTGNYTGPVKEDTSVQDNAAAKEVIDLINAIGTVTLDSGDAIKAARQAYNALLVRQQALVSNYDVLTAAEVAYAALVYGNAVADVMAKINAIGSEITLNSYTVIKAARDAYNALDDGQKEQVENYQVLLDAEAKLAKLRNPNPDKDTFDGFVFDFTDAATVLGIADGKNTEMNADKLQEYYANGTLNFNMLGGNPTPWLWNNFKNYTNTISITGQGYAGAWFGVQVKAPATGTFRFQFTYPSIYSVNLSTKIDAYMIPMSAITGALTGEATVESVVEALIASGAYAPVASKNVKKATNGDAADEDDFWGNVELTKDVEYAVIFRATENKHGGTNPATTTSNVWLSISGFSLGTPPTEQDIQAAQNVMDKIAAIGIVTAGSKAEIEAARAAYEALTDKQKELVENLNILETAEARLAEILDTSDGIEYIYKDPGNPKLPNGYPSGIGYTYGDFVDYARSNVTAFKPMSQSIQTQAGYGNGKWFALAFNVAEAGNYDLALNLAAATGHATTLDVYFVRADSMIRANGNEENQAFVDALKASDAYKVDVNDKSTWNLSGVQLDKDAYVILFKNTAGQYSEEKEGNINYMFNFRGFKINRTSDYTGPVKEDTSVQDNAAAKEVIDLINAIGTVTLDSGDAIKAARQAYNALKVRQQALVTNYSVLTAAEAEYARLVYGNAVADVMAKINAIGDVTLNSYKLIATARDAYNALDEEQKVQVENYQVLLDAEAKIAELRNPNPDKDTFDGFVFDFIDAVDVLGTADGKNTELTADKLQDAYENGTLNFNMLGGQPTPWLWNNFKNYTNTISITVQGYAGAWFGVKMKAPETGTFRIQFYFPATYNVNLSTKVDAYMIPVSAITGALKGDATVESVVEALIADGKYAPVASKNIKGATAGNPLDEDDFWGNVQVTKGEEYAVIFRATENKHGGTNPLALTSNVWLSISGFSLATPPTEQDIAAAQDVMTKIDAIGIVTKDSAADIKAARDAYDALTEKQKSLVENLNILEAAEARLAEILDTSDGIEYIYKDPGNPKLANGYPNGIGHTYGDFVDYARSNVTAFKPMAQSIQTQAGYGNGKWFGLKFTVAEAGDYDLALDVVASNVHNVTLDVYFVRADYLMKGNGNSKNQEYIDALAADASAKVYKVDMNDKSTYNLSGVQLDADDYVIVFVNTAGQYNEEKGSNTNYMFNFRGFKINRTGDYTGAGKIVEQPLPDPDTDKLVYDFYYGGVAGGTNLFNNDVLDLMNKDYGLNKLNWMPFAMKVNTVIDGNYSATYLDGSGTRYPWTGMLVSSGVGEWVAVQIKAPGTGVYDLTLEHGKNVNGSTTGKVYVIPVSALKDNSVETIEAAIADDTYKLTNSASFRSSNNTVAVTELGQAAFEKGQEYILVIRAATNKHGGTNPFEVNATTGANELYEAFILANKLVATKFIAPDPLNVNEVVYNFFREDFGYGTNIFSENALGTLMTEYIKGNSYWKPYASTVGATHGTGAATYVNLDGKNNKYEGIMTSSYVGEMLGIQLKSPGTGLFNIELTYGLTVNGANDGEIYLIPLSKLNGDLSNVAAMVESGEYKLQRDINFKAGYADSKYKTSLIGQANLEYGEEYVIVFRAASNKHGTAATVMGDGTPYQAFMIFKELKLTKTDTIVDNFEDPEPEAPDVSGQADPEAAAAVMALIDAIGNDITLASSAAITTARTAYELLTENQKALVTNYQKLVDAEAKLAELVSADDKAKADAVIEKIDAIGEVTLEAEGRIVAARIAYTLLTNEQRALVTNYATLLAAEAKLAELKGEGGGSALDQASADAVAALINKIGTVTLDSEMYISAARNAYNALTDAQKLLVDNYAVLVAAERVFAELKAEQDAAIAEEEAAKRKAQQITIMVIAAFIAAVAAGVVAIFAVPGLREKVMLFLAKFKKNAKK